MLELIFESVEPPEIEIINKDFIEKTKAIKGAKI